MNALHKKEPAPSVGGNPITEGVIWKQILLFFFPLLLSSFFQQLYNTADAVIVGQAAGKEALSAVAGSAGSVLSIFLFFYTGSASGAAVLAAQFFGAKKYSALRDTVRLSLVLSAILGLAGLMICFFLAGPILRSAWGLFAVPLHHTPNMVLAGFPVTWTVTSAAFFFYFRWYVRHKKPTAEEE